MFSGMYDPIEGIDDHAGKAKDDRKLRGDMVLRQSVLEER
jgi:hypothetical protein